MQIYRRINISIPLTIETLDKIDDFIIELRDKFQGVTWGSFSSSESAFYGWGLNKKSGFDLDKVTVIFTDVNPEEIHVERFAKELKQKMEKRFEPQQIWITIHDVMVV